MCAWWKNYPYNGSQKKNEGKKEEKEEEKRGRLIGSYRGMGKQRGVGQLGGGGEWRQEGRENAPERPSLNKKLIKKAENWREWRHSRRKECPTSSFSGVQPRDSPLDFEKRGSLSVFPDWCFCSPGKMKRRYKLRKMKSEGWPMKNMGKFSVNRKRGESKTKEETEQAERHTDRYLGTCNSFFLFLIT